MSDPTKRAAAIIAECGPGPADCFKRLPATCVPRNEYHRRECLRYVATLMRKGSASLSFGQSIRCANEMAGGMAAIIDLKWLRAFFSEVTVDMRM